MPTSTAFFGRVADVVSRPNVYPGLRDLATRGLTDGTPRETLMEWFEAAASEFPAHDDTILDVIDCLAGWCGPHAVINPTPPTRLMPSPPAGTPASAETT